MTRSTPGNDLLYGDFAGSLGADPGEYDDVVFGDYGNVTQNVFHAIVGAVAPGQLNGGYTRATFPVERIMTEGRILDARSVRFEDGGVDTIFGNGGDDFLFGGKQGDTIDGANGENVVFGDHGAITGFITFVGAITISGSVVTRSDTGSFAAEGFSAGMRIQIGTLGSFTIAPNGISADGRSLTLTTAPAAGTFAVSIGIFNRPILDSPPDGHDHYPISVLTLVTSLVPHGLLEQGGNDTINTGVGRDMVFGGGGADSIVANFGETTLILDHNNIVFGDYGFVDYGFRDYNTPDYAHIGDRDAHDIDVISSVEVDSLYPGAIITSLGGNDTITTGKGEDIIMGGTGNDVLNSGQTRDLVFGDNARITASPVDNPDTIYSVHEFTICVIETIGFLDSDSGADMIYGSPNADILFGGGGDDVIYGFEGDDIIFGDQGKVSCANDHSYDPDDPLNGVCIGLGGALDYVATNVLTTARARANDLIYAGEGDDIVFGEQGNDVIFGGAGDDILVGGSNVAGALDNVTRPASASTATSSTRHRQRLRSPATTRSAARARSATSSIRGCAR